MNNKNINIHQEHFYIISGDADRDIYPDNIYSDEELIDINDFNNYVCEDEFVEYIDDDLLKNKLVEGYTFFEVINNVLYSVCVYKAKQKLTPEELVELREYTQGQWSDGIGESFEQNIHNGGYLSMWHKDQEIKSYKIEDKDYINKIKKLLKW